MSKTPNNAAMTTTSGVHAQPDGSIAVQFVTDGLLITWRMQDQGDRSNDWRAVECNVQVDGRGELTAADLRALPLATSLKTASAAARRSIRPNSQLASVTDPPVVWRQDGRGRGGARSDRDYAELAFAYVSASDAKSRRSLPTRWSERFGGAVKTWQNRLSEARARLLLDSDDRLTATAERLLFGDWLDVEAEVMEAERRLAGDWRPQERERYVANARRIVDVLREDQRRVDEFYARDETTADHDDSAT